MDLKILHSWLNKYLETDAPPKEIARCLSLCGPSVEKISKVGKNDWLYQIEITTNRVDMMSVYGIAREAAAILPNFSYQAKLKSLSLPKTKTKITNPLPLKVVPDPKLNHRVMAVVLDNVKIANSPRWLKQILEANDIRSLNNIIDITNYLMTEIGHPCHVFDYDLIKDHLLKFRLSQKGETIKTLDSKVHKLPGNDIVIEDGAGNLVDLPGIMGTANSVVNNNTEKIILFIDNNNSQMMRATSMNLGIRTLAVTLNEKNVDPELGKTVILRGLQLYQEICKAQQASPIYDFYPNPVKAPTIEIDKNFIDSRIGIVTNDQFIKSTLKSLGFGLKNKTTKKYQVTVPSWRVNDIKAPIDLVEEIARIYGYHNLPSVLPQGELPPPNPQSKQFYWEHQIKLMLKYLGFTENYNYSLISPSLINQINDQPQNYLKLKNPLSNDWLYLRKEIYPSLIKSISENQNRSSKLNFFELSNIYLKQKKQLPQEVMTLSLAKNNGDYYDLKGIIEYLAHQMKLNLVFKKAPLTPAPEDYYQNLDQAIKADIYLDKTKVGFIGQLSTQTQNIFNLKNTTYIAQLNFQILADNASTDSTYTPIPKYPAIIENLTFFNLSNTLADQILNAISQTDPLISQVKIIDFFKEKINLEISYQSPNRNLTDKDIAPIRKKLVKNIESLGLKLQGEV